ncbi:MAG: ATP-dependent RecD-like DNA helicase, partial [bacterium]
SLQIIEETPEKLSALKGISLQKAKKIGEIYKEQFGVRSLLIFFSQYGITPSLALRIFKRWGAKAVDIIKDNPYLLCDEIYGIGFTKSDEMAVKMGMPMDSNFRLSSGIKYVLRHNLSNGHTFLPRHKLLDAAISVLNCTTENVESVLEELISTGELFNVKNEEGLDSIYLTYYFRAENYVSIRLNTMNKLKEDETHDIKILIDEIEKSNGIQYAKKQREAISECINNKLLILTGGPGTGKTTTLRGMIALYEKLELKVALAAPTGRAAKRMEELTGKEAKTIHRLLEMEYTSEHLPKFAKNESNPLDFDVIILDEVSMVDIMLMEALLRATPLTCSVMMVGDADQLPPVGAGNVLKDIVKSEILPTVRLDEIFRQASQSLIIVNAHKIIKGEQPDLSVKNSDFFFIRKDNSEDVLETVIQLCSKRLPQTYNYSPLSDIQVLSPSRKSSTGTAVLNERLREAINPFSNKKKEKKVRDVILREGDKVMQTRNNYDIVWSRENNETGTGIFNGDIGIIDEIDFEFETVAIRFEDRTATYDFEILEELEPAYAITVHKSQGSEFNVVVLPIFDGPQILFYRSLLYTAVTRAKQMVIVVGSEQKVRHMVENNRSSGRYSGLKYFLLKGSEI